MLNRKLVMPLAAVAVLAGVFAAYWQYGPIAVPAGTPRLASTVLPKVLPQPYRADAPAKEDVERAFARAKASGKRVIVHLGANWCPDCRALAGMFELPDFKAFAAEHYEQVHVDVNKFERNVEVVKSLGLKEIESIPTVLIFTPQRELLNLATSEEWHSASTRNAQSAMNYFAKWAKAKK